MPDHAPRRILLGLLGSPIGHSASPRMHEAAAAAAGLRCHYQLIEVAGADERVIGNLLDSIRKIGFAGINVAFPYKEAVLGHLDGVEPLAARIAAVNTIVNDAGRLVGHNTDVTGFRRGLTRCLGQDIGGTVVLIGAGGVGKAIAFALADLGVSEIRVVERELPRAEALAHALAGRTQVTSARSVAEALAGAEGLVNASPVGMLPNRDTPVPLALLHDGMWVADAVYQPLRTPLLISAAEAGARTMTGRDLVIDQASDAFRLFTGLAADRSVMATAFDRPTVTHLGETGH